MLTSVILWKDSYKWSLVSSTIIWATQVDFHKMKATLIVNAAVVAIQWQHCVLNFFLAPTC